MKFIFFTKYTYKGPSSRYRAYQYFKYFEQEGYEVVSEPFFSDHYLDSIYKKQPVSFAYFISRYIRRIRKVLLVSKSDKIYIEYELLPYFPAWLELWLKFRKYKYAVDYDDAIQYNYKQNKSCFIRSFLFHKIPKVIKNAESVITGSECLTKYALRYNRKVFEIPTSVDFEKYERSKTGAAEESDTFRVGWVGSPSSSINVLKILPALELFGAKRKVILVLIGFDVSILPKLQNLNVECKTWNEEQEIEWIKSFDVGIMPLDDTFFNRGKCGFKLVQYMACGIPTISTPLPANINLNRSGENLFATSTADWITALEKIYCNRYYFKEVVGGENKNVGLAYYSIQANHKKLIQILKQL